MLALLGPSGSGKTTLLRIIAGLEYPDSGRVVFGDRDATSLPVQQREVGFVFQHYALFKHMTVADNIAYGLRARPRRSRPPKQEIVRRVETLLDLVRLSGLARRYPAQLSGGQRQRVALARALAVEPRVLLLDEPFGALDAQVRKDLRRWLREIHDRTGQTTIFVTHDQEEALELADRVAVLSRGRLEQIGTPEDVQEEPATATVMEFLGDTIMVEADARDGRIFVQGKQTPVFAPQRPDGSVRLYTRAWQLSLADADEGHIPGVVRTGHRTGTQASGGRSCIGAGCRRRCARGAAARDRRRGCAQDRERPGVCVSAAGQAGRSRRVNETGGGDGTDASTRIASLNHITNRSACCPVPIGNCRIRQRLPALSFSTTLPAL